ncbi:NUDIX hydrolase [Vibrio rumoiensis]|uniref:DNA mismatch repair protein MutT n=1 Tax=Vibrio rumoiensis 1S-45 TaxID=1188252 RepID=A0A1E5DZS4_9VIBR|nr:NUDIX hydrolase [Vibrio rumoiensis]OEF23494.1 DNA mismatch repair protein MutT [Vibrio rumoiensis 1S-45]
MKLLRSTVHPDIQNLDSQIITQRLATRAITMQGDDILLLYTERYHDYSLPGGGLDEGEEQVDGMIRELEEETGALSIRNVQPFGFYEEYRPWHKDNADVMHMISYCYTCNVDKKLGNTRFESHEINNGMKPVWINLHEAIEHNLKTIELSEKKGMSIERETFILQMIADKKQQKES